MKKKIKIGDLIILYEGTPIFSHKANAILYMTGETSMWKRTSRNTRSNIFLYIADINVPALANSVENNFSSHIIQIYNLNDKKTFFISANTEMILI